MPVRGRCANAALAMRRFSSAYSTRAVTSGSKERSCSGYRAAVDAAQLALAFERDEVLAHGLAGHRQLVGHGRDVDPAGGRQRVKDGLLALRGVERLVVGRASTGSGSIVPPWLCAVPARPRPGEGSPPGVAYDPGGRSGEQRGAAGAGLADLRDAQLPEGAALEGEHAGAVRPPAGHDEVLVGAAGAGHGVVDVPTRFDRGGERGPPDPGRVDVVADVAQADLGPVGAGDDQLAGFDAQGGGVERREVGSAAPEQGQHPLQDEAAAGRAEQAPVLGQGVPADGDLRRR